MQPMKGAPEASEAVLLIGNPAIDFRRASPKHEIWDLGAAWFEMTKLPFVYAVWAMQRNKETEQLRRILREAKDFGLDTLDYLIENRTDYDRSFRKDYLGWHIHYHLGTDEKRGVAEFVRLLKKHSGREVFRAPLRRLIRAAERRHWPPRLMHRLKNRSPAATSLLSSNISPASAWSQPTLRRSSA